MLASIQILSLSLQYHIDIINKLNLNLTPHTNLSRDIFSLKDKKNFKLKPPIIWGLFLFKTLLFTIYLPMTFNNSLKSHKIQFIQKI